MMLDPQRVVLTPPHPAPRGLILSGVDPPPPPRLIHQGEEEMAAPNTSKEEKTQLGKPAFVIFCKPKFARGLTYSQVVWNRFNICSGTLHLARHQDLAIRRSSGGIGSKVLHLNLRRSGRYAQS